MDNSEEKGDRRKRLREMLEQKKGEVRSRITEEIGEKLTEDIASTLGPALDEGDLGSLELDRHIDYGILTMYTETLKNIEHALERLDESTYGTCEECGEEIGEKRLQALPFAIYCVDCQREREKFTETDRGKSWMERRAEVEARQTDDDEDT